MTEVTLRGESPTFTFQCYGIHEAKGLGIIDSWGREGTHAPVSTIFEHGEGHLLAEWIKNIPDAILIATGRYQITVFRPKSRVQEINEKEEAPAAENQCEEPPAPPRRNFRVHQYKSGDGEGHLEGMEGDRDPDSFADVAHACDRRLGSTPMPRSNNFLFGKRTSHPGEGRKG